MTAGPDLLAASPLHAEVLAAIHAASFPPGARWGADAMALQLGLRGAFGWIATYRDQPGGMILARVAADEAEILTLAVAPPARRQGLGRHLLASSLARAGELGAATMFLEVAESNAAALGLYRGLGFVSVGMRPRYYPDAGHAVVMRAIISCESQAG